MRRSGLEAAVSTVKRRGEGFTMLGTKNAHDFYAVVGRERSRRTEDVNDISIRLCSMSLKNALYRQSTNMIPTQRNEFHLVFIRPSSLGRRERHPSRHLRPVTRDRGGKKMRNWPKHVCLSFPLLPDGIQRSRAPHRWWEPDSSNTC